MASAPSPGNLSQMSQSILVSESPQSPDIMDSRSPSPALTQQDTDMVQLETEELQPETNELQQDPDESQQDTDEPQQDTDEPQQDTDEPQQDTDEPQQDMDEVQQETDEVRQETDEFQQDTGASTQPMSSQRLNDDSEVVEDVLDTNSNETWSRDSRTYHALYPYNLEDFATGDENSRNSRDSRLSAVPSSNENSNSSTGLLMVVDEESVGANTSGSESRLPEVRLQKSEHEANEEPPAKIRKLSPKKSQNDNDCESCPICFETWGNSGDHRVVSLKCGHLFGSNCVERWLKNQPFKSRSCPTCKSKASLKDLRFIYARRLIAVDSSEVVTLQKQLELVQSEKMSTELELHKSRMAHRTCLMQLEALRRMFLKKDTPKTSKIWRFAMEKNLEITGNDSCRVLAYNSKSQEIYASHKCGNDQFPGYGVRLVNCVDYRFGPFICLHSKPLRALSFSQPNNMMLSVSLDGSAKAVDRGMPFLTFRTGIPLWSCAWDYVRNDLFYVGGASGVIHQYDRRNPNAYVQSISAPNDISPVISIRSTEYGLLSCHLNSSWLWSPNNVGELVPKALPVDGSFTSLDYDPDTHRALVAGRPNPTNRLERSKIHICKLSSNDSGEPNIVIEQTFDGSTFNSVMSRSGFVYASGSSWASVYSESDSMLFLNGLDDADTIRLRSTESTLDVISLQLNTDVLMATLSKNRLRLYKAIGSHL